ncbi:MAG: hypothetical protein K1X79_03290 [Oligoflexia bacterium]|nr:hypothetical protein [Oligoflexia bacterium]
MLQPPTGPNDPNLSSARDAKPTSPVPRDLSDSATRQEEAKGIQALLGEHGLNLVCCWPTQPKGVAIPDHDKYFAETPVAPFIAIHSTQELPLLRPRIYFGIALTAERILDVVPVSSPVPILAVERACQLTALLPKHVSGQLSKSIALAAAPGSTAAAAHSAHVEKTLGSGALQGILDSDLSFARALVARLHSAGFILDASEIIEARVKSRMPDIDEFPAISERCRASFILQQPFSADFLALRRKIQDGRASAELVDKHSAFAYLNEVHYLLRETMPAVGKAFQTMWEDFQPRVLETSPQFEAMQDASGFARQALDDAKQLVTDLKITSHFMSNAARALETDLSADLTRSIRAVFEFNRALVGIGRGLVLWALAPGRDEASKNYLLGLANQVEGMLRSLNGAASERLSKYYSA